MSTQIVAYHATRRHTFRCRASLSFISGCFIGSAVGTLLGQAPAWPAHEVWAVGGFASAFAIIAYVLAPCLGSLQVMTATVAAAATLRACGYAAAASSTGLQWAGAGAWFAVAAYAIRTHADERRHFL